MRIKTNSILIMIFIILIIPALQVAAEQLKLSELVRNALDENIDILSSSLDVEAERLRYESAKSGNLPSLGFTTDSGNNTLYSFSRGDEVSLTNFPPESELYTRHKVGGGLSLGVNIPTGGSLSLTGAGSLGFSLADSADEWNYIVNPALSLYFRQPLFTDRLTGSPIRFDSMNLADEFAGLALVQSEIASTSIENNLIIAILRTSLVLNNLRNTYELLTDRLDLAQRRLELAFEDEAAGRLNSLDRLAEELLIRRQQEALIELEFQIESAELDLQQLSGVDNINRKTINLNLDSIRSAMDVDPLNNFNVASSEAARRSLELAGTVVPSGNEPVVEVSGLIRRADQDEAGTISDAFNDAGSSEMNISLSMAVSFDIVDWGQAAEQREAEQASLLAAGKRLEAAEYNARLQTLSAMRNLELIEEKFVLLQRGYEYDESLLEREQVRFEAGLTSELALETIKLDRKEREYQIMQLNDEKSLALFELYNSGGIELKQLF
ncbi:MAG TPA: hypothetical protein DCO79_01055 [Spirochaeta sp.]|nr:hypothetical protein [Spirochaeta sp.]